MKIYMGLSILPLNKFVREQFMYLLTEYVKTHKNLFILYLSGIFVLKK